MIEFLKKPFVYATIFAVTLTSLNTYVLLKTYLIPSVEGYAPQTTNNSSPYETVTDTRQEENTADSDSEADTGNDSSSVENAYSEPVVTDTSYSDGNINISISTIRAYDTNIYVADVTLSSAEYLKTALASDTFGRNITQKTSETAQANNAIFAVNGDYYGANSRGYVIKNGVIYRDTVRKDSEYDDLVIYSDGSFGIVNETSVSAQELVNSGVVNLFAFGPTLVSNGQIAVSQNDEVGRAMANNPRTAIGIVDNLHYIIVVSDGRTNESTGLSLYQLAQIMQQYGCKTAYNLDGGGSSTMYFNGQVINNPTTNGRKISERAVSDIVYLGY